MSNSQEGPQMPTSDAKIEKLSKIKELIASYQEDVAHVVNLTEQKGEADDTYAAGGPVSEGPFDEDVEQARSDRDNSRLELIESIKDAVDESFLQSYLAEKHSEDFQTAQANFEQFREKPHEIDGDNVKAEYEKEKSEIKSRLKDEDIIASMPIELIEQHLK